MKFERILGSKNFGILLDFETLHRIGSEICASRKIFINNSQYLKKKIKCEELWKELSGNMNVSSANIGPGEA